MTSHKTSYHLKRFTSSRDPDFIKALTLYVQNTAPSIRTNSNEITSWVDGAPPSFCGVFSTFGFYVDKLLVAYAEGAYLSKERIFVVDYATIAPGHRHNNVFFELVAQLKRYLEAAHPDYRYVLTEVAYGSSGNIPCDESRLLIRLLKMQGFGVIGGTYYQPRLALDYAESEMRSELLIYSPAKINELRRETYLALIHAIYYEYYLPWMTSNDKSGKRYRRHLDQMFERIVKDLKQCKILHVNGHGLILTAPTALPLDKVSNRGLVTFVSAGSVVVVATIAAVLELGSVFHESDQTMLTIFVVTVLAFLAIAGIVSKDARAVLSQIIPLIKSISGRTANDSKPIELPAGGDGKDDPNEQGK